MKFNFQLTKKAKKSKKLSNLVYYDADTKLAYSSSGSNVIPYVKKLDNKLRIVSTFPFDSLLKTNVEVPKTIDEVDLEIFLTENAYKQLNIALDAEYEMAYFKIETSFDADNWTYDVYLVDSKYLEKTYGDLQEKIAFLDVVTSVPFLPLALYKTGKLDTIANHIFVYIGNNSGSFIFYSKGEPVYIKTLGSNIHRLRVEFNQESSLELNSIEFENVVAGKSSESQEYKTYLDSMLNKISRDIEENITYIKRVYQDLDPTAIYYGMSIEYDSEFLNFFRDTFLIETKPFNSLASIDTPRGLLAVADIAMTYGSHLISNPNSKLPNFSHLKRPKPISQRDSAQFILAASALFALSLVYPIYNFAFMGFFSVRSNMLQSSYDMEIFPKAEQYRADEANLKKQIESLQNEKKSIDEQILALRTAMGDIYSWQVAYIQKSKILNDILQIAKSSSVQVIKATANSNSNHDLVIELNLFAKTQKDITDFIRALNERDVYKSVITDKVERIGLDESARRELNDNLSNFMTSVGQAADAVASAAKTAANTAANAVGEATGSTLQPLSAEVNYNAEPASSYSGYLNSIVKVVVR